MLMDTQGSSGARISLTWHVEPGSSPGVGMRPLSFHPVSTPPWKARGSTPSLSSKDFYPELGICLPPACWPPGWDEVGLTSSQRCSARQQRRHFVAMIPNPCWDGVLTQTSPLWPSLTYGRSSRPLLHPLPSLPGGWPLPCFLLWLQWNTWFLPVFLCSIPPVEAHRRI